MTDDRKGRTHTERGATIAYEAVRADGPGFYYSLPDCAEIRNWGPFPTRDIARRWHEEPSTISDDDITAIRKAQGYE